ncbi:CaiB/BaiF CoA transferase family protein [Neobacillus sp. NRS-1170]|uniref:CaiB/BaiF CoA transferase family protein n=1 Tax=Neobacillus sp. NRS-1170 TaxID=3233898 RepID=UPI003D299FE5
MDALTGIRVLDLTRLLPGPYCTQLLGDLGAEIIKVEEKGSGDYIRELNPGTFYAVNRNKKSLTLDLKQEVGRQILLDLAANSDVVIESFRPGVVERLGIDYQSVKKVNPGIVYCSISGYGQDGPYRLEPAHDLNCLAMSGALSIPGQLGYPPVRSGLPVADLATSMFAAFSIVSALLFNRETGKGQYIDVSMSDSVFAWSSTRFGSYFLDGHLPETDDAHHLHATNEVYTANDGKRLAIAAIEDQFWQGLCHSIDRVDLLTNPDFTSVELRLMHKQALRSLLQETFLRHSRDEWIDLLKTNKVPATPVNDIMEASADPQLKARSMIQSVFVPQLNRDIQQAAFPAKLSETPAVIKNPPPEVGEHTYEILNTILKLKENQIAHMEQIGVI